MPNGARPARRYPMNRNTLDHSMPHPATSRKTLTLKNPALAKPLEYRVVWNGTTAEWEIYRNGVKTGQARRKKQSAIDMAVLAIKSDESFAAAKAVVVSVKDGAHQAEWTRPASESPAAS